MGSSLKNATNNAVGQSIIELTLVLSITMLCIFASVQNSNLVRTLFKHEYVIKESTPLNFDLKFNKDILVFSDSKSLKKMKLAGWELDPLFKSKLGKGGFFLKKDNQRAFIFNQLGVIYE